jgi:hypothetical protein
LGLGLELGLGLGLGLGCRSCLPSSHLHVGAGGEVIRVFNP